MLTIERHGSAGPAIVLLHELGGNASTFRWLVPHLGDYRIFAVNLPGTSGSDPAPETSDLTDIAARVATALSEAGVGPATIVGLAGGAGVAAALGAVAPERVAAVVYSSLGAAIDSETAEYIRRRVPLVREHGMEHVADRSLARSYPAHLRTGTPATPEAPEVFAEYRRQFVASNIDGYVTQGLALAASGRDLGRFLSRTTAPTVVVGGEVDELFPPATVDAAAAQCGNLVSRVRLPGVAHLAHLQAPRALAGAIVLAAGCATT